MTRLKAALDPRSVAIIGASENPNKVGGRPVHYLDKFGFKGKIFPINPSRPEVQGHKCYKSLADLPEAPDMTIVAGGGGNDSGPATTPSVRWRNAPRAASRSRW
jgi:acetate---CoA ligase (ADP-forming)